MPKFSVAVVIAASLLALSVAAQELPPPASGRLSNRPTPTPTPTAEEQPAEAGEEASDTTSAAGELSQRAMVELAGWKVEAAAATLDQYKQEYGSSPRYTTALGVLRAEEGKLNRAVELLSRAANAKAADAAPEYYRGEVLYWQKKQDQASQAWQSAVDRAAAQAEANPDDARAHYYRGAALVRLQKPAAARTALSKAGELGYSPLLVTYQTGLSHFVQGQWQKARQQFDEVAERDPRFAYVYFYRGLTWNKLGRKDNMINDLDQFVQLAPNSPDADTARTLLSAYSR